MNQTQNTRQSTLIRTALKNNAQQLLHTGITKKGIIVISFSFK